MHVILATITGHQRRTPTVHHAGSSILIHFNQFSLLSYTLIADGRERKDSAFLIVSLTHTVLLFSGILHIVGQPRSIIASTTSWTYHVLKSWDNAVRLHGVITCF